MIHARTDYDRIQDPAGLIGDDEPVMLFRAKDKLFIRVLQSYAWSLQTVGADAHMVDAVKAHIQLAYEWQAKNSVKTPDMPADAVRQD